MLDARDLLKKFHSGEAPVCLPHGEIIRVRHYSRDLDYDSLEGYFDSTGIVIESVEVVRFPEGVDYVYRIRRFAS